MLSTRRTSLQTLTPTLRWCRPPLVLRIATPSPPVLTCSIRVESKTSTVLRARNTSGWDRRWSSIILVNNRRWWSYLSRFIVKTLIRLSNQPEETRCRHWKNDQSNQANGRSYQHIKIKKKCKRVSELVVRTSHNKSSMSTYLLKSSPWSMILSIKPWSQRRN